jgi:PPOX class probable F420-dependent enzyme
MNTLDQAAPYSPSLSDAARRFLEVPRFAVVATLNRDGSPFQAVVWYRLEGDAIIFNSRVGRHWPNNLERCRLVSLLVADGYEYVELRGEVTIDEDPIRSQEVIAGLARRYRKDEAAVEAQIAGFVGERRVTFELRPRRVFERLSGK